MINRIIFAFFIVFITISAFADDPVAKVIKSQGDVNVSNAKNELRSLTRGSDIFAQDTVMTSANGFVTLRFTDGTVIDLAANSKYAVHDYHFSPDQPKNDKFSSEIVEGGFRAISGTIATRSPTAFSAKARLTTLTVRGTYFYLMTPPCATGGCTDVVEFTLEGTTALNYKGQEFLTGPSVPNSTFNVRNGEPILSNRIPTSLPATYSSSAKDFQKDVKENLSRPGAMNPPVPGGTPPQSGNPPGSAGGTGSSGGGTGSDPCGTLKAVGGALPNTKP
jgi:hypothetical protein